MWKKELKCILSQGSSEDVDEIERRGTVKTRQLSKFFLIKWDNWLITVRD